MPGPSEDKQLDDNDAWLEVLAGRSVDTMDEVSRQQAERVRAALIRRKVRVASTAPPLGDAAFERLLFRMKREGVDSGRARPMGRQPLLIGSIAASLMLVSVVAVYQASYMNGADGLFGTGEDESKIYKSTNVRDRVTLETADIQSTLEKIRLQMTSRGIKCTSNQINKKTFLFDCPQSFEMLSLLDYLNLKPPSQTGNIKLYIIENQQAK